MMYPFITLDDQAEIVHSDMRDNGEVKVYIETVLVSGTATMNSTV